MTDVRGHRYCCNEGVRSGSADGDRDSPQKQSQDDAGAVPESLTEPRRNEASQEPTQRRERHHESVASAVQPKDALSENNEERERQAVGDAR